MLLRAAGLVATKKLENKKKAKLKHLEKVPRNDNYLGSSREESYELSRELEEEMFQMEGGGLLGKGLNKLGSKPSFEKDDAVNVGSVFMRKSKDFKKMNEL